MNGHSCNFSIARRWWGLNVFTNAKPEVNEGLRTRINGVCRHGPVINEFVSTVYAFLLYSSSLLNHRGWTKGEAQRAVNAKAAV
jgi:hypothetical protein